MENLNNTGLTNIIVISIVADIIGLVGAFSLILILPWSAIFMVLIIVFLLNHLRSSYTLLFTHKRNDFNNRLADIIDSNVLLGEE